jgi:hypothetical protein
MNWELDDELSIYAGDKLLFLNRGATAEEATLAASAPKLRAAMRALYDWAENNVAYGVPAEIAKMCDEADCS